MSPGTTEAPQCRRRRCGPGRRRRARGLRRRRRRWCRCSSRPRRARGWPRRRRPGRRLRSWRVSWASSGSTRRVLAAALPPPVVAVGVARHGIILQAGSAMTGPSGCTATGAGRWVLGDRNRLRMSRAELPQSSSPPPPMRRSLAGAAVEAIEAGPPARRSGPAPPVRSSRPGPPIRRSRPALPSSRSLPRDRGLGPCRRRGRRFVAASGIDPVVAAAPADQVVAAQRADDDHARAYRR